MAMNEQQVIWQDGEDQQGTTTREFIIHRADKRSVTGAVWQATVTDPSRPLVLFGHGASGDRYQAPISYLANQFVERAGFSVLSIDGPVHGLRQVGPGGREAFWPEWRRDTCIDDMVEDWQLAISVCQQMDGHESAGLAYFGLSMGSIFGIPLIAARNDVVVATLGLIGVDDQNPHQQRLLDDAASVQCPLLFIMQLEDELFDREGYLKVFDAFASRDKRIHANTGRHPEIPGDEIQFAFDFMLDHIRGTAVREVVNPLAE
jgi:pimeloyl-ACP methyl ester carboxylesterase